MKPNKGTHDDKAHSPIYPIKPMSKDLNINERIVYEIVARSFLACCSKNAEFFNTEVIIEMAGENFKTQGKIIVEKNFLNVYIYVNYEENTLPIFNENEMYKPSRIEMVSGKTNPPRLLNEFELIDLMDKNGIGTDATIHEHIRKITQRNYVTKISNRFSPTNLGIALFEGYNNIILNESLTKPFLRSNLEKDLKNICNGLKKQDEVLNNELMLYKGFFERVNLEKENIITVIGKYFNKVEYKESSEVNKLNNDLKCYCGVCTIERTVKQGTNIGKQYFSCQKGKDMGCKFFLWKNDLTLFNPNIKCRCDIGCILRTVSQGPNLGKKYYGCLKGYHKGCKFFQWKDEQDNKIKIDLKCYCGADCVERTAKTGKNVGNQFFTCYKGKDLSCGFFIWKKELSKYNPNLKCHCGGGTIERVVSEGNNIGKLFYGCLNKSENNCNFFKWKEDQNNSNTVANTRTLNNYNLNTAFEKCCIIGSNQKR